MINQDWIVFGNYYSRNMVVTGFNISKTPRKETKQTNNGKKTSKQGQNITITVDGYLFTESFDELNKEVDAIYAALNQETLRVVLGANPEVFYLATWESAQFDRKPGQGGHNAPFSISFQALEDSAQKTGAAVRGWRKDTDLPKAVTQEGYYHTPYEMKNIKAVYGQMRRPATYSSAYLVTGLINLVAENEEFIRFDIFNPHTGNLIQGIRFPNMQVVKCGISCHNGNLYVYVNGMPYEFGVNIGSFDATDFTAGELVDWLMYFDTPIPYEYNLVLNSYDKDNVLKRIDVDQNKASFAIDYKGTADTGISIFSSVNNYGFYSSGEFGCEFYGQGSIIVNGIDSDIIASDQFIPNTLGYAGKRKILPSIKPGRNLFTKSNSVSAQIYYVERYS